jgi:hypothetical protein
MERRPTSTTFSAAAIATAASTALPPALRMPRPTSDASGCDEHTTPLVPTRSQLGLATCDVAGLTEDGRATSDGLILMKRHGLEDRSDDGEVKQKRSYKK